MVIVACIAYTERLINLSTIILRRGKFVSIYMFGITIPYAYRVIVCTVSGKPFDKSKLGIRVIYT